MMIRKQAFYLFLKVILLKDIWLIMLISAVQQSDSLIHVYMYSFSFIFKILVY